MTDSGVDVTVDTTNHEDFKVQIRTFLAADNPPDVLTWFAGNRMRYFVSLGLVEPVTDLYQSAGWEPRFPEGIEVVSKGADEQYYFVPSTYYSWKIWYRKSLFEQAGIAAAPTTWEELFAACDALTGAGVRPFTLGSSQPWTTAAWFDYLNMRINGPEFHIQLMDGASDFRLWRQHVLPLSLPSLAALATLEFTWIFNDYLWALVLIRSDELKPVTTGLSQLIGQYQREWNVLFAGTLIAVIPTVILFIFLQRFFIQGLTMGSNK